MKILIRNKKWETSFNKITLICEVTNFNKIFNIKFSYNGNEITIKTNNLDKTFNYLERIFNSKIIENISNESKMVS
ncbi:hypothetical protein [uncultured Fusobacterium sp.]|uniref:hypothetical protein n=1 Tax=uncultured Fusobacterium sp. TaxID=159267 RepID=UPI0025E9B14B|nr:hypothetical protein [uncultured Fusobacterium sp.]